ncbi:hypothetical protein VTP01DRAFT_8046 [Rhizomucor pusillus]|uniref:uncharacterized protein n=1 Tax=Rhizomucor pusillus TaxID=4840 RepID=UPI003743C673
MFRFDSFRRPESGERSSSASATSIPDGKDGATMQDNGDKVSGINKPSFLQRMTSTDGILRPSNASMIKRPSFSSLQSSLSSSTVSSHSSSISIPIPSNSWGMLTVTRLQDEQDAEFDDIKELLATRDKAILLLPVSQPSHPAAIIDRDFIQDHVIVHQGNHDMSQVITLSGIRGTFQNDQFVALGMLPSEREISSIMAGSSAKRSLFDTFSLDPSSITADYPKYNILASHVQMPLKEGKSINAMLIQRPISKTEITEWEATKKEEHSNSLAPLDKSMQLKDPLAPKVNEYAIFIKSFRRRPVRNLDQASSKVLEFLDNIASQLYDDEKADKEKIEGRLDNIESFICYELYEKLFSISGGDEVLQDEALESRIAALNLLDLDLQHLGVLVEDPAESESIENIVREAGLQLQQLNSMPSAKEKLRALVHTHQVVVDAIEQLAEKYRKTTIDRDSQVIHEMQRAMSNVNEEESLSGDQQQEKAVTRPDDKINNDDSIGSTMMVPPLVAEELESTASNVAAPSLVQENTSSKATSRTEDKEDDKPPLKASDDTASLASSNKDLPSLPERPAPEEHKTDHQTLRSTSADVLLPLLIFTVVKSNPTNFLSNLKFIQRFRRPSSITGQDSYCLTNMMAVVSFLETTNLVGLGLSADKVMSNVTDFKAPATPPKSDTSGTREGSSETQANGLKIVSDVMDSSYRMFDGLGRLWQRGQPEAAATEKSSQISPSGNVVTKMEEMKNQVVSRVRTLSSATENELKTMPRSSSAAGGIAGSSSSSAALRQNSAGSHDAWHMPRLGLWKGDEDRYCKVGSVHGYIHILNNNIASFVSSSQQDFGGNGGSAVTRPSICEKFLSKDADELTIREARELLLEYQRLAKFIKSL